MSFFPVPSNVAPLLWAEPVDWDPSIAAWIRPIEELSTTSLWLSQMPIRCEAKEGETFVLPRFQLSGPPGGGETIRIGLFGGIHGDEPAGALAIATLLQELEQKPELLRGFEIFAYPLCNPRGFIRGERHSPSGLDLNREFWKGSPEPEVRMLEIELTSLLFDGIIALHSDDTSDGVYGFVGGATLTRELLEPALSAAGEVLPVNRGRVIDSFPATGGIIETGYSGILSAPSYQRPKPFEIIFETPALAPLPEQVKATRLALLAILESARRLQAYAANL